MKEKERALIINSDPQTRIAIFNCLLSSGYEVSWVKNRDEALKLGRVHQPNFLIVDVKDNEDPSQLLQFPEASDCSSWPVLYLMEKGNLETFKKTIGEQRISCVKKPIVPKDLIEALKDLSAPSRPEKSADYALTTQRNEISDVYHLFFSNSRNMEDLKFKVDHIAKTDITILIMGENGAGKELLAKAIYEVSNQSSGPFVKVNCASIPKDLMESELFGYERGAFTGANQGKPGKFDLAMDGTIFLDEVSEIDYSLQAKLLQVLQNGEFSRLGGGQNVSTNARIIASTKVDLELWIKEGRFRKDLFYRLNMICIPIPPLRERKEDIPQLAAYFGNLFAGQYKKEQPSLSEETIERLMEYHWPGNVRELQNVVKNIVLCGEERSVIEALRGDEKEQNQELLFYPTEREKSDLFEDILGGKSLREVSKRAVEKAEKKLILKVLSKTRWNRRKACEKLDLSYKTMLFKIREYGLDRLRSDS